MTIEPQSARDYSPEHLFDRPSFIQPGEWPARRFNPPTPVSSTIPGRELFDCANKGCPFENGYMGLPYCEWCAWDMWATLDAAGSEARKTIARTGRIDEMVRISEAEAAAEANYQEASRRAAQTAQETKPGHVYYLRVGDLIKIGWTADLKARMRAYPPNTELLADHPGTMATEKELHNKFLVHLAKGREWFKPSDAVMDHIEQVKQQFPKVGRREAREKFWAENQKRLTKNLPALMWISDAEPNIKVA